MQIQVYASDFQCHLVQEMKTDGAHFQISGERHLIVRHRLFQVLAGFPIPHLRLANSVVTYLSEGTFWKVKVYPKHLLSFSKKGWSACILSFIEQTIWVLIFLWKSMVSHPTSDISPGMWVIIFIYKLTNKSGTHWITLSSIHSSFEAPSLSSSYIRRRMNKTVLLSGLCI